MKIRKVTILEIDSIDDCHPIKGVALDYILVNSGIGDDFYNSKIYDSVVPMLKTDGKIIYH